MDLVAHMQGRGEWGTLDMWVCWTAPDVCVMPLTILPLLKMKRSFLMRIYLINVREGWMTFAGFVINVHFFAKKVMFCYFCHNLISHRVLGIETSQVISNQL